ncbi:hypothetical protein WR25_10554 [Diploscapter pachys]|uniref:Sulfite oxidase n=1 Tax=Diploscapter pachys TaxID=2018661 RepID=A0A2A2JTP4_9BILA|nr:hypothetical protein WR25_10554 [Diploscapter pachys]
MFHVTRRLCQRRHPNPLSASLAIRYQTTSSYHNTGNTDDKQYSEPKNYSASPRFIFFGAATVLGYAYYRTFGIRKLSADAQFKDLAPPERKDLPIYKRDDVKKHGKGSQRIWVTFQNGVYDVTDFIESHPGGDKILLAAGDAVDPYWQMYAQHKKSEVLEILEEMRIGTLDPNDIKVETKKVDVNDPYANEPVRHPALVVANHKPFNAETPPTLLVDHFRTPNEFFFVRNHLPVPDVDVSKHHLQVEGLGVKRPLNLSVDELKNSFAPVHITSAIQCSGNRRANMNAYKKVQGLMWKETAISNAKWTGVRLRDLLIHSGVDPNDKQIKHVHLEGADKDPTGGQNYGASIPFEKAMSPETIVAYKMNDEDIPRDHGAPLRLIVPGVVGARQVKWLKAIRLSDVESPSHWQQKDYRVFSASVNAGDELKWETVPSIQEYPIQSAFCIPQPGAAVSRSEETIDVAGYAWSGGGRGIIRVEISTDGGKTWQTADIEQDPQQDQEHMWSWTLFKASVKIPEGVDQMELVVKATDRSYNTQPETSAGIWNIRGLLNNAWHKVEVKIKD